MNFNRVCNLEDWQDDALRAVMADVFPREVEREDAFLHRKMWEIAQAIRALRAFGAVKAKARILGVGAGTEATSFFLTKSVAEVHATDLYAMPDMWSGTAPLDMLICPRLCAPFSFNEERLIVQHMDARALRYPDNHFDGLFSSSSIEHFGTLADIEQALDEIGRVLKPGGVAALSTELHVGGDNTGGWQGVRIFDRETLYALVEQSVLEPVDALDTAISPATLRTVLPLGAVVSGSLMDARPHIVLEHQGNRFTSVALVLRKPKG